MSMGAGGGVISVCSVGRSERPRATPSLHEPFVYNNQAGFFMGSVSRVFALLLLFCSAFVALPAAAQDEGPAPIIWSFEGEAGASVFFGASDQTTIATKIGLDRKGSRFLLENDLSYLYGEATGEAGNTFVNKRSWAVGSNLDYRGFSWVNPYLFGSALSSLEKAIAVRYKGGAGAKLTALDSETTRLDFALAVLGEETRTRSTDNGDSEFLARWTGEFGFKQSFSEDRTVFQAKAAYNPVFDEFANYTVEAETSIAFRLSEIISLKLSVTDNYDSRAEERGALGNNDGRVLFSVLSSF